MSYLELTYIDSDYCRSKYDFETEHWQTCDWRLYINSMLKYIQPNSFTVNASHCTFRLNLNRMRLALSVRSFDLFIRTSQCSCRPLCMQSSVIGTWSLVAWIGYRCDLWTSAATASMLISSALYAKDKYGGTLGITSLCGYMLPTSFCNSNWGIFEDSEFHKSACTAKCEQWISDMHLKRCRELLGILVFLNLPLITAKRPPNLHNGTYDTCSYLQLVRSCVL